MWQRVTVTFKLCLWNVQLFVVYIFTQAGILEAANQIVHLCIQLANITPVLLGVVYKLESRKRIDVYHRWRHRSAVQKPRTEPSLM